MPLDPQIAPIVDATANAVTQVADAAKKGARLRSALATYGTLSPGEANHWVVSRIAGEWIDGTVRGYVFEIGWGPAEGHVGFIADAGGQRVPVSVLVSDQLAGRWHEIDKFEGPGYKRAPIVVELADDSTLDAHIYIAITDI